MFNQPRLHISAAPSDDELSPMDTNAEIPSRSGSVSSSLDPYYFGIQTPADSPAPQLPEPGFPPMTPETRSPNEPVTPGRDPANIDRMGLVGVGELATPRWGKIQRHTHDEDTSGHDEQSHGDDVLEEDATELVIDEVDKDGPDSPWTIEAVDGESDGKDEVRYCQIFII
jgi:dual specificity tyrosine-phosphorylation-regulated kinase 2/3/4